MSFYSVIHRWKGNSLLIRLLIIVFAVLWMGAVAPANAFHFPWDQGHDTTEPNTPPPPGPCEGPQCNPCSATGSPLYIPTGHFIWRDKDIDIFGRQPLTLIRTYNSNDPRDGIFGNGWSGGCEEALYMTTGVELDSQMNPVSVTRYILRLSDGKRYEFRQVGQGPIEPPEGRYEILTRLADGRLQLDAPGASTKIYAANGNLLSHTDRSGVTLTYSYLDGRIDRKTDDNGHYLAFSYNSQGRVATVTDHTNRTWSYVYDVDGNLVSVTDPLGGIRRYEYQSYTPVGDGHTYYQMTRVTDPSGVILSNVTYANDRVSQYSELENVYRITYSDQTKTVTKVDTTGTSIAFTYNEDQQIVREVDGLGGVITSQYDEMGNLVTTVDQEGQSWHATYDNIGRVLTETDPLGNTLSWSYQDRYLWPIQLTSPSGRITQMQRNAQGDLVSYQDPSGAQITNTWSTDGLLLSTQDAQANTITYTYDALGRKVSAQDPLGRTTSTAYDDLSRVVSEVDAKGNSQQYIYDALGRVTQTIDRLGNVMQYTYDSAGRLLVFSDARGNQATRTYDAFGRLATKIDPNGATTVYSYMPDNSVAEVMHPDGVTVRFAYDANKRLIQKIVENETFTYTYNGRGQLIGATNTAGTIARMLDAAGQISQVTMNGATLNFAYNVDGERIQITGLGGSTDYTRDARGLITGIADVTGNYALTYDVNGLRTGLTYPNGVQVTTLRDMDQQIQSIAHTGVFTADRNYTYDAVGNIAVQTVNGDSRSYVYDDREQLISANYPGNVFNYSYDVAGNLLNENRLYNDANELVQSDTHRFEYDARGNLTRKTEIATGARVEYQWSAVNELKQVTRYPDAVATVPSETLSFTYGPLGRRFTKTTNGQVERYVYDGFNRVGTLDGSGAVINRVVFGTEADEPLGMSTPQGNQYFYADALGSVVGLADATSVVSTFEYSPYGLLLEGSVDDSPFGYTGREMDAEDLYFYRTRYYDPTIQRFLSRDPIGFVGGVNQYAYVEGNPINNADPLGLQRGSPEWCRRQLERIRNIENKIKERISELREDPLGLPESCPGDDVSPSLSRRGHRRLINMDKANLAAQQALYQAYCTNNPPPPPVPVTEPETSPNTNPSSGVDWNTVGAVALGVVVVIGIGALIYFSGGLAAPAFASSRRRKRYITRVDEQAILDKAASLDVLSWEYNRTAGVSHIGPMSEDFHAAFGLGANDKEIAYVDANGVLYASVKALRQRLIDQQAELDVQRDAIAALRAELDALTKRE